ncbi:hypothetical protein D1AOALGA4SA_10227 [Olavius algarvensis Delta 1 endosymbiont]|nr:hypothetical protein D1AOALGA4SA_10227 [Olavius algarvensis Delta 1 endosymbiont]
MSKMGMAIFNLISRALFGFEAANSKWPHWISQRRSFYKYV